MKKTERLMAAAVIISAVTFVTLSPGCGPSPKVFAQRMNSGNVDTRRAAAKELRGQKLNAQLIQVVVQACRDPDHDVRVYAYYAIGRADPHEEGVVPAILDGMADTSVAVRRAAVSSLGSLDPFPSTCLPYLVKILVDPDEKVRRLAFAALVDRERDAMGSLMRGIDSKDDKMRLAIIEVMAQIGTPAKAALTKLRQIAREDENKELRDAAEKAVRFIER
jgi:HEAT repeat protein